jgi:hypothetical protein
VVVLTSLVVLLCGVFLNRPESYEIHYDYHHGGYSPAAALTGEMIPGKVVNLRVHDNFCRFWSGE